ncbi:MAG: C1 family peptidase [Phycisphaerales bacterium]
MRFLPCAVAALPLMLAACASAPPSSSASMATEPQTSATRAGVEPVLPTCIDLRPTFAEWNLPPRPQGHRGTCSIFTTCEAIEFAHAKSTGKPIRLSPEFVNWAASQAAGGPSDGNFFFNAVAGFEKHGVCTEERMPYRKSFDAKKGPSTEASAEAAALRDGAKSTLRVRWIQPWKPDVMGVSEEMLQEMKRVIASGYPVAAGSGHSRLFVGYHDNPDLAGGGAFITEDSALNRYDEVTYRWVRDNVADAFWVEALPATTAFAQ